MIRFLISCAPNLHTCLLEVTLQSRTCLIMRSMPFMIPTIFFFLISACYSLKEVDISDWVDKYYVPFLECSYPYTCSGFLAFPSLNISFAQYFIENADI